MPLHVGSYVKSYKVAQLVDKALSRQDGPAFGVVARWNHRQRRATIAGLIRGHLAILTCLSQELVSSLRSLLDVTVADPPALEFLSNLADTLAAGTVDLPAFPQVVIKVQEAFKDPSYTPQKVARVISTERTLADRLLQMANSTAFNATGRVIIDLGVAINRLGAQKVYSVALGLDELWSECVTVAHFSEAVAKRSLLPFPGAFAAGLLHGIGRFYILVKSASQGSSRPRVALSAALVDAWHPAIAKAVLKNWQMDEAVCEAVGAQAELNIVRAGPPTLTDLLIASIRLANRMQNSYDTSTLNAGGAFARLDLTAEACKSLIAQASDETRALQRALRP
jgi:HD-like signal output (HDOD) protein